METLDNNSCLIAFDKLDVSAIDNLLSTNLDKIIQSLDEIERDKNISWQSLQLLLYLPLYNLNQSWVIMNHLLSVNDSEELRGLHDKYQNRISEFYVRLGQSKKLYENLKHIKEFESDQLNHEEKKIIENEFRDFVLSGIELDNEKQSLYKSIQNQLSQLTTKFEQNVLDSTDKYVKYVKYDELKGIPEEIISQFKRDAIKDNEKQLYKITLHMPSYLPIMQYCENRALREELYYQYVTRASEFGVPEFDNSQIICKILQLRHEKAQLLGFKNFAELSLFTKMANNSKQVLDFLYELSDKSKPHALKDLSELKQYAADYCNIDNLETWDVMFVSEKLQQFKYSYSNWELKQYFPLTQVLDGLFKLIHELYHVEFKPNRDIPMWYPLMQSFDVIKDSKVLGYLYIDLFARNGKQSGAWMNSLQERFIYGTINKKPIAGIMCNFTPPASENEDALLTFDEVQTLFHEMGHALHLLLSNINHYSISGINGVEWDAVELPSQFMEYFAWDHRILKNISSHIKTGEKISDELYQKLLNSRHFQSGLAMARQLEFAILDILLHENTNFTTDANMILTQQVRNQVAVIFPPQYNRFLNSFSHIFAGGYASGYYSYKWAEVLATDIFNCFEEAYEYSDLGNKFHDTILSKGGLHSMLDNFVAFMGREPKIDALLKYSGIN